MKLPPDPRGTIGRAFQEAGRRERGHSPLAGGGGQVMRRSRRRLEPPGLVLLAVGRRRAVTEADMKPSSQVSGSAWS